VKRIVFSVELSLFKPGQKTAANDPPVPDKLYNIAVAIPSHKVPTHVFPNAVSRQDRFLSETGCR
jgi:hypothetical protein